MSEMVERVARAILEERYGNQLKWGDQPDADKECAEEARAAINAMREPTETMVVKGDDATWEPSSDRPYIGEFRVKDVWSTMINEALK